MSNRIAALLVLPLVFALAACTPTASPSTSAGAAQSSSSPTASPTPTPVQVDPAQYLIEGTPGVFDASGEWYGRYAFFTDSSKSVFCDIIIFSGDDGGVGCRILPAFVSKRTYALPAGITSTCTELNGTGIASDGTSVRMGSKALEPNAAGWEGCTTDNGVEPTTLAATKVLMPGQVLTVTHDVEKWSCSVSGGIAHCTSAQSATASMTFGLSVATFTQ